MLPVLTSNFAAGWISGSMTLNRPLRVQGFPFRGQGQGMVTFVNGDAGAASLRWISGSTSFHIRLALSLSPVHRSTMPLYHVKLLGNTLSMFSDRRQIRTAAGRSPYRSRNRFTNTSLRQ
jgi:hypothetical protein